MPACSDLHAPFLIAYKQICRARRAKCDNEKPCSYCRRIGATCSSEPISATAGFDPASLAILAKLEELQSGMESLSGHLQRPPSHSPNATLVAQESIHTISPVQAPLALRLDRHLQRGNISQVLAWDIWQPHELPQCLTAGEDEPGANPTSFSRARTSVLDQGPDISLFTGYLDAFFSNVHVLNPVLAEQQIRAQLSSFQLNGIGWDADSFLLLLVLANGASSSQFGELSMTGSTSGLDEQRWANAQALFDAAEKRKDTLWRSDYLTQARCHFYSGMFMMVSMRPFDAWRHFLQGLATCQRSTASAPRRSPRDPAHVEKQAKESIYWSCWKSERELRFELDMPNFSSAGYDHPIMFPTLPQQVFDQEQLRAWYFYLAEISLWRSEMTARKTLSEFVRQQPGALEALAERIGDLEESLTFWRASLPDAISLDAGLQSSRADVLHFVLHGRLTYNYEVLTWPFLETQLLFGEHRTARASELAAKGVRVHYDRLSINRAGFYYRHHGTWLMQRSSARSACILLAVARSKSSDLLPTGWQEIVSDTIAMLEYWSETPDDETIVFLKSVFLEFMQ
ncbi:uncharacterized protein N7496_008024 [Penicillium cataractarum]|uniref:Zn(2)-C6 fungal-type domain-containing protein n=1 Tax=Penicillium cataractarum TaxID=2100454 RepID=A0A9W9RZJ7_9EURO|nr:uncharacterized protein N7496_008024 [Penicillium cataractarum]KAJ5368264.1 hypothetical protein N7496_008024 [Penicillium cataractarum]